jgi:hypothetical protein
MKMFAWDGRVGEVDFGVLEGLGTYGIWGTMVPGLPGWDKGTNMGPSTA